MRQGSQPLRERLGEPKGDLGGKQFLVDGEQGKGAEVGRVWQVPGHRQVRMAGMGCTRGGGR